jgi:hypothetical protein
MPLGHDKMPNSSDEEDYTISGLFPDEAKGHTDSSISIFTVYLIY